MLWIVVLRRLLRVPWTARRSKQSILKEINLEYSLEGLLLKLKPQSFVHLMWRASSLEKTLRLGKIEGRRRGWQRMRWLDSIKFNGHEFKQTLGASGGQGSLACCNQWGHRVRHNLAKYLLWRLQPCARHCAENIHGCPSLNLSPFKVFPSICRWRNAREVERVQSHPSVSSRARIQIQVVSAATVQAVTNLLTNGQELEAIIRNETPREVVGRDCWWYCQERGAPESQLCF